MKIDKLKMECSIVDGPQHDKTCLQSFRESETQTNLLSYREKLENLNFACGKFWYDTFQISE